MDIPSTEAREIARQEWRKVEKPLIKRIRKAYGLRGFRTADRAMDDLNSLRVELAEHYGGWRPGIQTIAAKMVEHNYLHAPGIVSCDCPKEWRAAAKQSRPFR